MDPIALADISDSELESRIVDILRGKIPVDALHDETPTYAVFNLYQSQDADEQKERIEGAVRRVMMKEFVDKTHERLDGDLERLLADLAYLAEAMKIRDCYGILRGFLDRGSLGLGTRLFHERDTERKILRALMSVQPPKLLYESVWYLYWEAVDPFFWDVAYLGIRRSDRQLAISLLPEASERWAANKEDFDFPVALWGIVRTADAETELPDIRDVLTGIDQSVVDDVRSVLESMGLPQGTLEALMPRQTKSYRIGNQEIEPSEPFYAYHHRDLDGIGCAVLWTHYLTRQWGHSLEQIKYMPVDHDAAIVEPLAWPKAGLQQPAAVFDYIYHPDALVFYNHHDEPFATKDALRHASDRMGEPFVRWTAGASSAIKVLFADLQESFKECLADRYEEITELVSQIDRIDGARFANPTDWLEAPYAMAKLNLVLLYNRTEDFCSKLTRDLVQTNFVELVGRDEYREMFEEARERSNRDMERVHDVIEDRDGVILYDAAGNDMEFLRFAPYHFYPSARFVVGIYAKRGAFEVSVGQNPFEESVSFINIGSMCQSFTEAGVNGGGHQTVGGVTVKTKEQADEVSRRILHYLGSSPSGCS